MGEIMVAGLLVPWMLAAFSLLILMTGATYNWDELL